MKKKSLPRKGRMIHIRLDDSSHRRLKIHAAQSERSIQQIVERLIQQYLPSATSTKIE